MYIIILLSILFFNSENIIANNHKEMINAKYENIYLNEFGIIIGYTNTDYENLTGDIYLDDGKTIISNLSKISTNRNGIITYTDKDHHNYILNHKGRILKFDYDPMGIKSIADDFISYKDDEGNLNYFDIELNKVVIPQNIDLEKYKLMGYLGFGYWIITPKQDINEDDILLSPFGLVNNNGVVIEPQKGFFFEMFINGVSLFTCESGKYGYLDKDCKLIVDTTLLSPDIGSNLENGITKYNNQEYSGYIFNGKKVIEPKFDLSHLPLKFGGNFYIKKDNKYGIYDSKGNFLVDFKYDDITQASQEITQLFIFKENNKYGFKDKSSRAIVKPIYDFVYSYVGDYAIAKKNKDTFGVIDKSGNIVIPFDYSNITYSDVVNYFIYEKNQKKGLIKVN